jgi:hypothetical protein
VDGVEESDTTTAGGDNEEDTYTSGDNLEDILNFPLDEDEDKTDAQNEDETADVSDDENDLGADEMLKQIDAMLSTAENSMVT